MSLLERVELARGGIDSLRSLRQRAAQAGAFEQRAKALAEFAAGLESVQVPAAVLAQAEIAVAPADEKLLAALRARAGLLKDGYARDRSFILAPFPDEDFRFVFAGPCTSYRQKAEAALRSAWSGWIRSHTPAIDHEVLRVLSTVNGLSTTVTRIQAQLAQIACHAAVLPQNAADVQFVGELCTQANGAWHALAGDGIASDVLDFLRNAGSPAGASHDALTPSILQWLDEHNLRRVLRVRLG